MAYVEWFYRQHLWVVDVRARTGHTLGGAGAPAWDPMRPNWVAYGIQGVKTASLDGRDATLPHRRGDGEPRFSPDGRWIALLHREGSRYSVHVQRRDGTSRRQLGAAAAGATPAVWSPDGRQLAWSAGTPAELDVWIANADGRGSRRVTSALGVETSPTWSPDGRWLAYVGNCRIHVVSAVGGVTRRLAPPPPGGCDFRPAWRPSPSR